ncbi:NAD binding Rossmann fold oxidoreductase [Gymnopilus junonius]|uniref:D-xylose 1-dehydrogenase (NADP(+), D-xylono-1,5-lactone-forming) n=1 Tax=Gymnopilus junonius TaxID=109634 RepID=A0A9P5TIJ6_GYMJU|nr:NAD binding Rossmann fold oxidoreductase [Gymnopilus junonius]
MTLFLQGYTAFRQYVDSYFHSVPKKSEGVLKVGVLSTAMINGSGIIYPALTHPEVVLYAVASRDASKATYYASKYGFQKSYGSYEDLLADPEVDFVYISLPNSLHFEWACKSLEAGKHVLLEKPFTSNAREAAALVKKSKETGKVLLEAFHWQFHPQRISKKYGEIISTDAAMTSTPALPPGNIRWQYDLAGGSLMDMTYVLSFTRYALRASVPDAVLYAKATPSREDPRVDSAMQARLRFKRPNVDPRSDTKINFYNAMMPHIYHYIAITDKITGKTHYEQFYKGGPLWKERGESYWSTYRYQLEAFVDKVQGRHPVWWIDGDDSVQQMESIDAVYRQSGLPLRPTSTMLA